MIKIHPFKTTFSPTQTNSIHYTWYIAYSLFDCVGRTGTLFNGRLGLESEQERRRNNVTFATYNRQIQIHKNNDLMLFIGGYAHGKYYAVPKEMNYYRIPVLVKPSLCVDINEPLSTPPYRTETYHREGNLMICDS